jgi:hypothetical protein
MGISFGITHMDRSDCESTANRPTSSPTIAPLTGAGPGLRARYPVPATSTAYRCRSRNPRTVPRTLHSSSTTSTVAVPICASRTSADCLYRQHPLAEGRLPGTADPAGRDVAGALVLQTIAASSEQSGSWLASAMEASWAMAEALLSYPQLADLLAERHKIIGNNWQNACTAQLIAR